MIDATILAFRKLVKEVESILTHIVKFCKKLTLGVSVILRVNIRNTLTENQKQLDTLKTCPSDQLWRGHPMEKEAAKAHMRRWAVLHGALQTSCYPSWVLSYVEWKAGEQAFLPRAGQWMGTDHSGKVSQGRWTEQWHHQHWYLRSVFFSLSM